jgi:virginiamycin A acetyltransferase
MGWRAGAPIILTPRTVSHIWYSSMNARAIARQFIRRLIRLLKPEYEFMADNPAYSGFAIGKYTYGRPLVMYGREASLKVGKFSSIGDGTDILLGGNHRTDWVTTYPFPAISGFSEANGRTDYSWTKGDVVIGNDVWIGQNVIILSGVIIGDGAVIGAGSVVAKSIPPYTIAVGNPARVVRNRFSEQQVNELLRIRWWDWPLPKIKKHLDLLMSGNVNGLIETSLKHKD